ncbi:MAG: type II toxin-antitoxin system RelE/ParE family toxin [Nitrospirae bacterium]|nr:type II toxin-antitoxin system RelE/ParE family toxin [Nitrospirota bacterium]
MDRLYKLPFKKFVKKQTRGFQLLIEDEIEQIADDPVIGEAKSGDLSGFRVHKFKSNSQEYLIAYRIEENDIVFYLIGTHENFYRDLKQYRKG